MKEGNEATTLSRRAMVLGTGAAVAGMCAVAPVAVAAPNGTRPTKLVDLAVVASGTRNMRVSGRLLQTSGQPVVGVAIKIYVVGEAYFSHWTTVFTGNDGRFTITTSKGPTGTWVQVEFEGNGAYCRPYPTFNRP